MERRATIEGIGRKFDIAINNIPTPGDEYNESHSKWRIVRQMKAIKDTVKEQVGLGSVLGTIALICSLITVVILIGTPAVKQGELNGTYAKAIDQLAVAQRDNKDETNRNIANLLLRVEDIGKQNFALAKDMQADMRTMREAQDRKLEAMQLKVDSTWNWMVELKNKLGMLEAEIKHK